jgi:hypothetical protein
MVHLGSGGREAEYYCLTSGSLSVMLFQGSLFLYTEYFPCTVNVELEVSVFAYMYCLLIQYCCKSVLK